MIAEEALLRFLRTIPIVVRFPMTMLLSSVVVRVPCLRYAGGIVR